ncbi:MAG: DUF2971 domain-containing protein [Sneathiella sp.]
MLVYYYTPAEYGIKAIEDQRLKISDIGALNDPFEYSNVVTETENQQDVMKKAKTDLQKMKGVICFSKYWNKPLMWAHYAEKHQGMALGFKVLRNTYPIEYIRDKGKIGEESGLETEEEMKLMFRSKHVGWKYEKESRLDVWYKKDELSIDVDKDLRFLRFEGNLQLREVILGCNCKLTDVSSIQKRLPSEVDVFTAAADLHKFEMIRS